ncbi:hypothetical protein FGE12_02415 [Aggregicoccus sp. 17bor-14]|uniref:hypothetical protein n=1 Tax=Myxococcaceae TaxID=31 RepID=UPI00129C8BE4|nr:MULTISPECIES: hypothetical protein [Myxococcaceae]MBF5041224.1 hypothetical protein [Simulacricoccus sp. 17bor-14]MRI87010.1 hypothetical protein [Aggregicoccus sp. 17bor-14]
MALRSLILRTTALVSLAAPVAHAQVVGADDTVDRFFPLSESASVPPTQVRAETNGTATRAGADGSSGYGVTQTVEMVALPGLALRAGGELRSGGEGFTPEVQAKYQFLRQGKHGVNLSAGARYKQLGFSSDGGEVELFVSAGRRWGQLLGTANFVAGHEMERQDADFEGHVGLGYLLTEHLMVGLNSRFKQEAEMGGKPPGGRVGREFELVSGGTVGYQWRILEASVLAGWHMPKASDEQGAIALMRVGLNF